MRGIIRGLMPHTTRTIGARYVGRLTRPSQVATPYSSSTASGQVQKITAAKIAQRVIGGKYMRAQEKKSLQQAAEKPYTGKTAAERAFLKKMHDRALIKPVKSEQLKNVLRGAYEVVREQGIKLRRYESGTDTEKVARAQKEIEKANTPPPPKVDPNIERMRIVRAVTERSHAGLASGMSAPTMEEPTKLPTSSATGWTKPMGTGVGLRTGSQKATTTGAAGWVAPGAHSTVRTTPGSPPPGHHQALVFGRVIDVPDEANKDDDDQKITLRESELPPPKAPALSGGGFIGGSRTIPVPSTLSENPYGAAPASSSRADEPVPLPLAPPVALDSAPPPPAPPSSPDSLPPPPPPAVSVPSK